MTIDEQIENLKSLGLEIGDEEYARSFLNDVSYFRLIKAYSLSFKTKNSMYTCNVKFEDLVELYLFNASFRQLLFAQIERVEVNLRCRLSNYFSKQYGVLGYEDVSNFQNPVYHNEFIEDLEKEISRNSKCPFVKNFQNNYEGGKLPLYAAVELFSFGMLSKFFKNMKNSDKKAVVQSYCVGYTYFESWIEHIAFVRNLCAHYGRLYNVNLAKTPMLYKQYSDAGIGNIRVYATLICLKHLLPNDRHWTEFVETIDLLLEKNPHVDIKLMGFPKNWKDYLLLEKIPVQN